MIVQNIHYCKAEDYLILARDFHQYAEKNKDTAKKVASRTGINSSSLDVYFISNVTIVIDPRNNHSKYSVHSDELTEVSMTGMQGATKDFIIETLPKITSVALLPKNQRYNKEQSSLVDLLGQEDALKLTT